eukprot:1923840-Karenia_brevis.AAC.1
MISKTQGGAGLHGPIIHDKVGWRFLHPGEGAALFGFPRDFHISHIFIESWERIGNSIPITLTVLGAGRVQNVFHALQSIQKSQGQTHHDIIGDGISPCNIHEEQQKVLNDCVIFPNPLIQARANHESHYHIGQIFIILPSGRTITHEATFHTTGEQISDLVAGKIGKNGNPRIVHIMFQGHIIKPIKNLA